MENLNEHYQNLMNKHKLGEKISQYELLLLIGEMIKNMPQNWPQDKPMREGKKK